MRTRRSAAFPTGSVRSERGAHADPSVPLRIRLFPQSLGFPALSLVPQTLLLLPTRHSCRYTWRFTMQQRLELGPQSFERLRAVAVLATLLTSHGSQAGGEVYQPDAALRRVLMLSAWPPCAKSLDAALGEQSLVRFGNHQVWGGLFVHCGASLDLWHDFDGRGSVWRAPYLRRPHLAPAKTS